MRYTRIYITLHYNCVNHFSVLSEQVAIRQSQIDKLYAGLKDLSEERRSRLQENNKLFEINREIDDIEQWIAEKEVVAGSHELGQDFEHVTVSIVLMPEKKHCTGTGQVFS